MHKSVNVTSSDFGFITSFMKLDRFTFGNYFLKGDTFSSYSHINISM